MKPIRLGLTLLYALATLVASGAHGHGPTRDQEVARGLASCDDPTPHFAGHWAPEVFHGPIDCLACQFRGEHQAVTDRPVATSVASRPFLGEPPSSRRLAPDLARPTCRGPPLA